MNLEHVTPELFAALAKAQGEVENASKNSANPHFRSRYADLAEVLNTVRPVFAKHGLSLNQSTAFDGALVHVDTVIGHSAGGYLTSRASCQPAKTDAQGVGSATTYLRRYALAAMAGVAQEDDDGNAAAHSSKPASISTIDAKPTAGAWDGVSAEEKACLESVAVTVGEYMEVQDAAGAHEYLERQALDSQHKIALWTLLDSKTRAALKKAHKEAA